MAFGKYERPYAIRDAAGLLVYESASFTQGMEEVNNTEAAGVAINRGEAVIFNPATSLMPRWDYSTAGTDVTFSTVERIDVLRIVNAASVGFIGVALETIKSAPGGALRIVVDGIVSVKCINPPSSLVVGAVVVGSATAGSVDTIVPNAAGSATNVPAGGTVLGNLLLRPGFTVPTQSGSLTQLTCRIAPR